MAMRIGELATRSGLPVKTIRYYSDIGVLPEAARTPARYRTYDDTALARLAFIRSAQTIGLTLGEIREILALRDNGDTPCTHVTQLIDQHAHQAAQRITELQQLQTELQGLARRAGQLDPTECPPDRVCHVIPTGI